MSESEKMKSEKNMRVIVEGRARKKEREKRVIAANEYKRHAGLVMTGCRRSRFFFFFYSEAAGREDLTTGRQKAIRALCTSTGGWRCFNHADACVRACERVFFLSLWLYFFFFVLLMVWENECRRSIGTRDFNWLWVRLFGIDEQWFLGFWWLDIWNIF